MNKILLFLFILALSFTAVPFASAQKEGASLTIYPQTGAFVKRSTFDVSVFLNTGGKDVGYVKIDLKFDPRYLQVVVPAKGLSLVSEWIFPPSFSNTSGIISLQGGFAGGGINSSEGLISVIVFQAKAIGKTVINFLDSSKVFLADARGTNILSSTNRGEYSIILSPPKGPQIFSSTHPDQNKWYRNNSPAFTWSKAEGVERFSYSLDRDPFGEPDNITDTNLNSQFFEGLEDGIWYFHLKAQKGKIWGGASHSQVNIDNSPPLSFKPRLEIFTTTLDHNLLFHFDTVDLFSGLDYYEARIVDMSDPKNILYLGFIRTESPYRFDTERKRGTFKLIIRAFDKAGNHQEGEADIRVITSNFVRADKGLYVFGRFFPLWFPVLVLGLIVITIIGIIIWRYERRKNIQRRLERDIKEVEEGLEDIKKLEEEIKEKPTAQQRLRKAWKRLAGRVRDAANRKKDTQI